MHIAVTGATGHLGGLVIESLTHRGIAPDAITAIVRDEAKAAKLVEEGVRVRVADYEDPQALTKALQGVDRLVLVSGSEVGKRVAQHENVINAAKTTRVELIVYTSLLNLDSSEIGLAPEHRATEQLLVDSGVPHARLRNGWYWENFASVLDSGRATGKFFGAAGSGLVSGAARRDYAEAAAVVVTSDGQAGEVYELAGSPSLSYQGIAHAAAQVIGSDISYVNQSVEELQKTLEGAGLPADLAAMLVGMDAVIEKGHLHSESTDLQTLIGRPSTPIAEALKG